MNPKRNISTSESEQMDISKCSVYQRSRGRKHKLCSGQNKSLRRWRKFTRENSDSKHFTELENLEYAEVGNSEMAIIPYAETESSVLDSIPIREQPNEVNVEILNCQTDLVLKEQIPFKSVKSKKKEKEKLQMLT